MYRGLGPGDHDQYGARDALACLIVRSLRDRGFSTKEARIAADWLESRSIRSISEELLVGRRFMPFITGTESPVTMLTDEEAKRCPTIVPASVAGFKVAMIDVRPLYLAVMNRMRAIDTAAAEAELEVDSNPA